MPRHRLPIALAWGHGIADFVTGWTLLVLAARLSVGAAATAFVLYNVIAFGGQVLCADLVDAREQKHRAAASGLLLLAVAVLMARYTTWVPLVIAGCGSALFHVAGGAITLAATPGRTTASSVFTAPGTVGLAIGAWLGTTTAPAGPILATAVLGVAAWVARAGPVGMNDGPRNPGPVAQAADVPAPVPAHEPLLVLLLIGISLRSMVWTALQYGSGLDGPGLVSVGLCAGLGKAIGGFIPDRVGRMRWTLLSSTASALLFAAGPTPLTVLPGVVLLQSTVPVALAAAGQLLPARPALASSLVLGLAVIIGGIGAGVAVVLQNVPPLLIAGIACVMAGLTMMSLAHRYGTARTSPSARVPFISLALMVLVASPLAADIVAPGPVGESTSLLGTLAAIAGGIGVAILAWLRRRGKSDR